MRRAAAYGPAIVLLVWAIFAGLGGDLIPVWLFLVAVTTAVMVRELGERYRDE